MSQRCIFVPKAYRNKIAWTKPRHCLWSAPVTMHTKYTLAISYRNAFSENPHDLSRLESFFVLTLGVPNCGWEHIVDEIRFYKAHATLHIDRARELYRCLLEMQLVGSSASDLK